MAHAQFTLDVRTGPVTRPPGEFEILPQKGSKGVVVQVPGKATLVNAVITDSLSGDEDDVDMEESTPFTAEDIRTMNYKKLKALCAEHKMFTKEWPGNYAKVPEMKEALMEKFGLEGSTLSDRDLKIEETNNAMAAFLKLANVLAIISNIRGFDPKNTAHAQSFMNEYRKQNGNGTIRSRKCT